MHTFSGFIGRHVAFNSFSFVLMLSTKLLVLHTFTRIDFVTYRLCQRAEASQNFFVSQQKNTCVQKSIVVLFHKYWNVVSIAKKLIHANTQRLKLYLLSEMQSLNLLSSYYKSVCKVSIAGLFCFCRQRLIKQFIERTIKAEHSSTPKYCVVQCKSFTEFYRIVSINSHFDVLLVTKWKQFDINFQHMYANNI